MMKNLLLSLGLLGLAAGPAQAISCAGVPDVTGLGAAGCDADGLNFSGFQVSASAGFTNATVGISAVTAPAGLTFQVSTTPGIGPGDVILNYHVAGAFSGVTLSNGGIAPVTIGEVVCATPGLTCAASDRLAELVVAAGETKSAAFTTVLQADLVKDINFGTGGFLSVFEQFHNTPTPVPEPTTLLLLGGSAVAGLFVRRRRG